MVIKARVQKDYYVTEVNLELPVSLSQIDGLLKGTMTTGKLVVVYNKGNIQGINIEQRTNIDNEQSSHIRPILGIGEKSL